MCDLSGSHCRRTRAALKEAAQGTYCPACTPAGVPLHLSSARVGSLAAQAAILEVSAGPKPGLVCRNSNGAHHDMDYNTFVRSALALKGYFSQTHAEGLATSGLAPDVVFPRLRALGIQAEQAMFAATGGVNTHKGLIFSLGLFCAALGRLSRDWTGFYALPQPTAWQNVIHVCRTAAALASGISKKDLSALPRGPMKKNTGMEEEYHKQTQQSRPKSMRPLLEKKLQRALSPGEVIYVMYGARGIRGEAEQGFPGVWLAWHSLWRHGIDAEMNRAMVHTLLELTARVEDSSILWRGGHRGLALARSYASAVLARGGLDTPAGNHMLERMGEAFVRHSLSPGGCADILAIGTFLHLLRRQPACRAK
ncbi:triphosphoribosyl-dephospho-CoA synthase [Desulfovibrio falkowii]|uniref:triphosphoribosyl-dephospho-CoA synthase n=1 Tax=Desulfovibrio sp. WGS1351 TaxID=3366814 RepID=UPI00372CEF05